MAKIYIDDAKTKKKIILNVGKRFAGGAAGDIHLLPDAPGHVLKIYKTPHDRDIYEPKLRAMIDNPPKLNTSIISFPQVAWPISCAEDSSGKFIGYIMPEVDFKKSKSLENMLQKRMRQHHNLPENYGYRISAAYNLCVAVAALHAAGHYIIDLKPTNCRLEAKRMLISIVDTDGFSVNGPDSTRYHANQFTPEYIAPEAINKDARAVSETMGEQQDLFALSVIIFRLLNNGLHPFQALLLNKSATELTQMIEKGYYAYGQRKHNDCLPAKQSVHTSFPSSLRRFFDDAFGSTNRPTAKDWQKELKKYADSKSGNLIQCEKNPDHAYFNKSKGCGWCRLKTGSLKKENNRGTSKRSPLPKRSSPVIKTNTIYPFWQGRKLGWIISILLIASFGLIQTKEESGTFIKTGGNATLKKSKKIQKMESQKQILKKLPPKPINSTKVNRTGFLTINADLRTGIKKNAPILIRLPKGTEIWVISKINGKNIYQVKLTDRNKTSNIQGFINSNVIAILN